MLRKFFFLVSLPLFVWAGPLEAGLHIWTGAVNERWSVAGNWAGGSPAGDPSAQLSFPPVTRVVMTNDIPGLNVRSISFSGAGYRLDGSNLTMTGGAELFDSTEGPNVIACDIVLQSDLTVFSTRSMPAADGGITLAGAIKGAGGIRLIGGGRLTLGGSAPNSYTGVTRSLYGDLHLRKPAGVTAVPGELRIDSIRRGDEGSVTTFADEQIADSAPVIFGEDGTLTVRATETIGPLTLYRSSRVQTQGAGRNPFSGVLIFGGDITVVGDFDPSEATGSFYLPASRTMTVETGPWKSLILENLDGPPEAGLTLNAASENDVSPHVDLKGSWKGPTVVNGGDVAIQNPETPLTLHAGSFTGAVTSLTTTGGDVARLWARTDVRLNAATTVAISASQTTPWYLNGVLDLGGASLTIVSAPGREFGTTYTLIDNRSTAPVVGTFAGLPEGGILDDRWRISYVGGTGNDITVTEAGHVPSTTRLTTPSQAVDGEPGSYTVSVTPDLPIVTPGGSATISKGDELLATVPIAGGTGKASIVLPRGSHELTVRYQGDAFVAPSTASAYVAVAAVRPTITSVTPSSAPGNSTVTLTILGSNFAPGAFVEVDAVSAPAEIISANELRVTFRTPNREGAAEVRVFYPTPTRINSSPLPFTLTTPLPPPATKLRFTATAVSAPVAPGSMSAWVARGLCAEGSHTYWCTASGMVTDTDNDGLVVWEWPNGPMPSVGIWIATDLATGEIMAGSRGSLSVAHPGSLPDDSFLRDPSGHFSHVIVPTGRESMIQWSRRGVGAWTHASYDGVQADQDRTANGLVVFDTSIMKPVGGSPATPAGVLPGDQFVAILHEPRMWIGGSIEDSHLGDTPGTATVSFPLLASGYAFENEGVLKIVVLREKNSDGTATVDYRTSAVMGIAGIHYREQAGRVTFGPGEVVKTIEIPLINDAVFSGRSEFTVTLSNPAGAALGTETVIEAVIADDERLPAMTLSTPAASAIELDAGTHQVPVTLRLQSALARPATVKWFWSEGSDGKMHKGTLQLAPGETQKTFTLTWASNTRPEETRSIQYRAVVDAGEHEVSQEGTFAIEDDDLATVSIQDVAVREGATAHVHVSLNEYSDRPVTVTYSVIAGSAAAGADYVAQSGTLRIEPPYTTASVTIPTIKDLLVEPLEHFMVQISAPQHGVLGNSIAVVTIVDDDASRRRAARHRAK